MAWGWLKKTGKVAAATGKIAGQVGMRYAETRYPFLGDLLNLVAEGVDHAEMAPGLTGAERKEQVMGRIDVAGEALLARIHQAGLAVADQQGFFEGASALVDAVHRIRKSVSPAGFSGKVPPGAVMHVQNGRIVAVESPE
jgi:hypothetical protein